MELLERYLYAFGKYIPARSLDLAAELRSNLESQIDDQEEALNRPLHESEVERILKEHGHPLLVAMRYHPQRYLIGPAIFPIYWRVLKTALPVSAAVFLFVNFALLLARDASPDASNTLGILGRYPGVAFDVAAWVTLIFACWDLFIARARPGTYSFESWSPRSLPAVPAAAGVQARTSTILCVLGSAVLLVWLLAIPKHLYLLLGPAAAFFDPIPCEVNSVWQVAYWLFVAVIAARLAVQLLGLLRRISRRQMHRFDRTSEVFGNVVFLVMTFARPYFLQKTALDDSTAQRLANLNHWAFLAMLTVAVIGGVSWIVRTGWGKGMSA